MILINIRFIIIILFFKIRFTFLSNNIANFIIFIRIIFKISIKFSLFIIITKKLTLIYLITGQ